uniref:Transmembrane protein 14C n=1 Tax=Equus caballus TaxID=9796 RepID=A0A9L0S6T2_HORSE
MQKDSSPLVPLHWIGFGYAALVASGGITGYAKAGSVPSLAAGLLFGGLAGLGAYQLSQDQRNIWGFLATSGTLAGIMGMRIAGASLLTAFDSCWLMLSLLSVSVGKITRGKKLGINVGGPENPYPTQRDSVKKSDEI